MPVDAVHETSKFMVTPIRRAARYHLPHTEWRQTSCDHPRLANGGVHIARRHGLRKRDSERPADVLIEQMDIGVQGEAGGVMPQPALHLDNVPALREQP